MGRLSSISIVRSPPQVGHLALRRTHACIASNLTRAIHKLDGVNSVTN